MARLLLVSNRLPVTVDVDGQKISVHRSPGGLATGLSGPHERSGGLWIGWTGLSAVPSAALKSRVDAELRERQCVGVHLEAAELTHYYDGYCNRILWPVFHYLLERLPLHSPDWDAYVRANEKFAEAVCANYQAGDTIWIHDYQLMLLPALLRERLPEARIGFFLHIPFPSSEVFRTLPNREQILRGLLGADLIGFHTLAYARHFITSLLGVLGIPTEIDRVRVKGRDVRVGAFPMGIDARAYSTASRSPAVQERVEEIRKSSEGHALLLGIDRLDYTKGIPRRLLAVERFLEKHPERRGKVRLLQVAVPSRSRVDAYEKFRREVNELVGRINGKYGTVRSTPVHYLYQSFDLEELCAMYRAADVMLVTPLRDGMNLVAKEFCAARTDDDGALVLSEFAGAAAELGEAVLVNPYDVDKIADAIETALTTPAQERSVRMKALRTRVSHWDVHRWVESFLEALESAQSHRAAPVISSPPAAISDAMERIRQAKELVLLLDYDGTLVNFVGNPELAAPGERVRNLLKALAARRNTTVHLVSGRMREQIDRWFSDLPIGLHAEHCYWSRPIPGEPWRPAMEVPREWMSKLKPLLERYTALVPGTFIEEKSASLAWHYRMADPEFGVYQANELYLHLTQTFANAPVEVLPGSKVVEVRPHGVSKALVVKQLLKGEPPREGTLFFAMGDDRTDEDLFAVLPPDAIAAHVGEKPSIAGLRVPDVQAAHALLRMIAELRR